MFKTYQKIKKHIKLVLIIFIKIKKIFIFIEENMKEILNKDLENKDLSSEMVKILNNRFLCYRVNDEKHDSLKSIFYKIYDTKTKIVFPYIFLSISNFNKNGYASCVLQNGQKAILKVEDVNGNVKIRIIPVNFTYISRPNDLNFFVVEEEEHKQAKQQESKLPQSTLINCVNSSNQSNLRKSKNKSLTKLKIISIQNDKIVEICSLPLGTSVVDFDENVFLLKNFDNEYYYATIKLNNENIGDKDIKENKQQKKVDINNESLNFCSYKIDFDTNKFAFASMFKNSFAICQFKDGTYGFLKLKLDNSLYVYDECYKLCFQPINNIARVLTSNDKYCYVHLREFDVCPISGLFDFCEDVSNENIGVALQKDIHAGFSNCFIKFSQRENGSIETIPLKANTFRRLKKDDGKLIKTCFFKKCNNFSNGVGSVVNDDEQSVSLVYCDKNHLIIDSQKFLFVGKTENGVVNVVDTFGKHDYLIEEEVEKNNVSSMPVLKTFKRLNLNIKNASSLNNGIGIITDKFGKQKFVKFENQKIVKQSSSFNKCFPFENGFGICKKNNLYYVVDENLDVLQFDSCLLLESDDLHCVLTPSCKILQESSYSNTNITKQNKISSLSNSTKPSNDNIPFLTM